MKNKVKKNPAAKGKINPIPKSKVIEQFGYPSISQRIEFDGGKNRNTYFSGTLKITDYEYAVIYERLFTKETKNINSFIKKELNVTESQFIFNPLKELIFKRCINLYPIPEDIETYTKEIIKELLQLPMLLMKLKTDTEKAKEYYLSIYGKNLNISRPKLDLFIKAKEIYLTLQIRRRGQKANKSYQMERALTQAAKTTKYRGKIGYSIVKSFEGYLKK